MKRTMKDETWWAEGSRETPKHRHRGGRNMVNAKVGAKREQGSSRWHMGVTALPGGSPHCDNLREIVQKRPEQAQDPL